MDSMTIIKEYVEGSLSPQNFQKELYYNKDIENILSEETQIPSYIKTENLFYALLEIDLLCPSGELDSKSMLALFLEKRNISFVYNNSASKKYNLFLKIQPNWLSLNESYFQLIMEKYKNEKGKNLEKALKLQIKKDFKFLKNRPKWLQSPEWPIINNKPLFFIGQIDITEIRHDTSYLYIFWDVHTQKYTTLEQSA